MNKARRKQLDNASALVQEAKGKLDDAKGLIEDALCEEEESFDNLPEGLQQSERGEAMEAAKDNMQEAIDELDNLDFEGITSSIDTAAE